MKQLVIAILFLSFIGCTNNKDSRRVLEEQGYTNISLTGYEAWGCSEDDTYSTGFTATSPTGQQVTGVVCGGWMKGYTVRIF